MHGLSDRLMHWQLVFYIHITRQYIKITEVNLSTFVYKLFHEYFSPIVRTTLVVTQYEAICFLCVNVSDISTVKLAVHILVLYTLESNIFESGTWLNFLIFIIILLLIAMAV